MTYSYWVKLAILTVGGLALNVAFMERLPWLAWIAGALYAWALSEPLT